MKLLQLIAFTIGSRSVFGFRYGRISKYNAAVSDARNTRIRINLPIIIFPAIFFIIFCCFFAFFGSIECVCVRVGIYIRVHIYLKINIYLTIEVCGQLHNYNNKVKNKKNKIKKETRDDAISYTRIGLVQIRRTRSLNQIFK